MLFIKFYEIAKFVFTAELYTLDTKKVFQMNHDFIIIYQSTCAFISI